MNQGQLKVNSFRFDSLLYTNKDYLLIQNISNKANKTLKDYIINISSWATPEKDNILYYSDKENGVPFLRVQNITENWLQLQDVLFITKDVHNWMLKRSILKPWNLVMTITWRLWSCGVIPESFIWNINQHSVVIDVWWEKIAKMLATYLNSTLWQKIILSKATWWTRPALDYQAIYSIPVIENFKIVEKMDFALNEKKRKEREAMKILESIDDFVLWELWIEYREVEEKKIYFLKLSELWETKRLDPLYNNPKFLELEKMLKNGKYKIDKIINLLEYYKKWIEVWSNEYIENWEIPFVRVSDIDNFWLYFENCNKFISKAKFEELINYKPQIWEVLFSKDWTIWLSCVATDKMNYITSWWILRLKPNIKIIPEYLQIILSRKIINKLIEQRSIWAIIKHLDLDAFESLNLPIPPLNIQEIIASEVKSRIEKAKELEKEAREIYESAKREVEVMILE